MNAPVDEQNAAIKLQSAYRGFAVKSKSNKSSNDEDLNRFNDNNIDTIAGGDTSSSSNIVHDAASDSIGPEVRSGPVPIEEGLDEHNAAIKLQSAYRGFAVKSKSNKSSNDEDLNRVNDNNIDTNAGNTSSSIPTPIPPECPSPSKTSFRTEKLISSIAAGEDQMMHASPDVDTVLDTITDTSTSKNAPTIVATAVELG